LIKKVGAEFVYLPTGESFGTHAAMWEGLKEHRADIRERLLVLLKENPGMADAEED
jgi:hypothetical protein